MHLPSNQTNLEKYLIKRKYSKIDEVIGLQYSIFLTSNLLDFKYLKTEFSKNVFQRIFILDNVDQLNQWINIYCSSFEISFDKRQIIYKILKEKFDVFYFIYLQYIAKICLLLILLDVVFYFHIKVVWQCIV